MYKVGHKTDFGKLVAESLIWNNPVNVVSIYEIDEDDLLNEDSPAYLSIIWDISDIGREVELSREFHTTDEDAIVFFLNTAYQVSL